jgi:serine protease AprX
VAPAHDDDPGNGFHGIAPDARIVSLKVADAFGATDVVQVLIAIDWVVKHRRDGDLDIRVLNLSFGTDATQDYRIDPLAYAVEMAWRRGIFVVVAAGNQGYGSSKLNAPAYDPYIMAVGASDPNGTRTRTDDIVASFSSRGVASRRPDLVAPGRSVTSLRTPGSFIDTRYPGGRVGPDPARFFRGSGTSQAAAVISGAAALVIEQREKIKPDQLKRLLMDTAYELPDADPLSQGEGLVDLGAALETATPGWVQTWPRATGQGTLEGSRGSHHLSDDGIKLKGEIDIFGLGFDAGRWAVRANRGTSFADGKWMGRTWTGDCWCSDSWSGDAWQGRSWTTGTWTGRSWTSASWTGRSWTSTGWTGGAWTGRSWTSSSWHGDVWSSSDWGP